ncbi:MAG: hypothetical protein P4L82_16005 [Ancalomicrobiaceae bacterium]|nr:hypothetical protein [Ancalomicrobiaceae bacterium]
MHRFIGYAPRPVEADYTARSGELPVESGIAEMRDLLTRMQPASDAEALQALRRAFPASPLAARVAAVTHIRVG